MRSSVDVKLKTHLGNIRAYESVVEKRAEANFHGRGNEFSKISRAFKFAVVNQVYQITLKIECLSPVMQSLKLLDKNPGKFAWTSIPFENAVLNFVRCLWEWISS